MIADLNVHWDIGADGQPKPHAHVMLTMREVGKDGFGAKVRDWNKAETGRAVARALGRSCQSAPCRTRYRRADRSPQPGGAGHCAGAAGQDRPRRIAHGRARAGGRTHRGTPRRRAAQRRADHRQSRCRAGRDHAQQATFTRRDLAMFVHRHSDGKEQFDLAMSAVRGSSDLIALGKDGRGEDRFTSRQMIETEQRLAAHRN
jgi:hypothetical protein